MRHQERNIRTNKTEILRFRLTPEEKKAIDSIRRLSGKSYSNILREHVVLRVEDIKAKYEKKGVTVKK